MTPELSAIVPTVGRSEWLEACLSSLRAQSVPIEIVLVDQTVDGRVASAPEARSLTDLVIAPGRNLGFAGGTNAGIDAARGAWIATVNDDATVAPDWASHLLQALAADSGVGCAQGTIVRHHQPARCDSYGLAWNQELQAIQLGHGNPAPAATGASHDVFGVAATAALFRRSALAAVALAGGALFDGALGSYYEDADLACRLRAAQWRAVSVPAARASHVGSRSSARRRFNRWRSIYGNRRLVLMRVLGAEFDRERTRLWRRDARDLARALVDLDLFRAAAIPAGWMRARHLQHLYRRNGVPLLTAAALRGSARIGCEAS